MGSSASHAAATAPLPPAYAPPTPPPLFDAAAQPKPHEEAGKPAAAEEKVDYMNLPCPVPYEEVQRESFSKFPGAAALV
jgi:mitochondrial import receptor subunit TOM40